MIVWEFEPEYILAVAPLAGALCMFPTLAEAERGELLWHRPMLLSPVELRQHRNDLVLSEAGLRLGQWWKLITYIFVHNDSDHLFANLQSILIMGLSVFQDVGALGMYAVFFLGGVASGANRWGRAWQAEAQLVGSIPRAPEHLGPVPVPELARGIWDSFRQSAARCTAPAIHEFSQTLGASGAACALMGYTIAVAVERLYSCLFDEWGRNTNSAQRTTTTQQSRFNLMSSIANLVVCSNFLMREWKSFKGDEGFTAISHVGHLTGFGAGVTAFLVVRVAR